MFKQIRISQTLSKKLNVSQAFNNLLQRQLSMFEIKLEQTASHNSDLKKQLEAKDEILRSKNEEPNKCRLPSTNKQRLLKP